MKVAVAVHGRFHGFDLARELAAGGNLARLYTTYPAFAARRFLDLDTPLACCPSLELVRRLHGRLGGPSPHLWIGRRFARFVAARLTPGADVLVGWSGAVLEAISVARTLGMRVVVERGSSHIAHQAALLAEEYARFGLTFDPVDPRMIAREQAEYRDADAIAVPTSFAAETFVAQGVDRDRLIINPYGVDLSRFQPQPTLVRPMRRRVLFVGRVGLRKGVPYLVEATRRLPQVDFHLVGPVEAGMEAILAQAPANLTVRGPLPGDALPAEYRQADLFCLPSLEEGLPLTLLQAMASGLPVVATPETGGADVVAPGHEGLLIPSRDPAAIVEAVETILENEEKRQTMGAHARNRVAHGHEWRDYGRRAVAAYALLTGKPA